MICGTLVSLALQVVLLGKPELKIESQNSISSQTYCEQRETTVPNAIVLLRDESGHVVLERKIRVGAFDFYNNGDQRGGVLAKSAVVFLKYPKTSKTERAKTIELRMLGHAYVATAELSQKTLHKEVRIANEVF